MITELLGWTAAATTTVAFAPQAIKTIRSRSTDDLSWVACGVMTSGQALWFDFGVAIASPAILASSGISFLLCGATLAVKLSNHLTPRCDGSSIGNPSVDYQSDQEEA